MAFKEVASLDADNVIALGGFNKKTKKDNPKRAEGYYLGSRQVKSPKSKTGFANIHIFQTDKGNLGVWGKTDMDRKLSQVTPGVMTQITFTGMKPTKNNDMYVYKVEVDEENTIEVSAAPPEVESTSEESDEETTESEEETEEEVDEDAQQAQALAAAERQAKVQALLNKNKIKKSATV